VEWRSKKKGIQGGIGAATVEFVDDNQVEEPRREFPIKKSDSWKRRFLKHIELLIRDPG